MSQPYHIHQRLIHHNIAEKNKKLYSDSGQEGHLTTMMMKTNDDEHDKFWGSGILTIPETIGSGKAMIGTDGSHQIDNGMTTKHPVQINRLQSHREP
jgi:hypothetical protein